MERAIVEKKAKDTREQRAWCTRQLAVQSTESTKPWPVVEGRASPLEWKDGQEL